MANCNFDAQGSTIENCIDMCNEQTENLCFDYCDEKCKSCNDNSKCSWLNNNNNNEVEQQVNEFTNLIGKIKKFANSIRKYYKITSK